MFKILMDKNVPYCVIRVIKDNYLRQNVCVMWDSYRSPSFSVSNGVKQGGVMSPILFTMYIDVLLLRLKDSGIGCHINNVYIGALAYADDITLLCPSIRGINTMLSMCKLFATEFDLIFNEKKHYVLSLVMMYVGMNLLYLMMYRYPGKITLDI
jgi:hypothetical protein